MSASKTKAPARAATKRQATPFTEAEGYVMNFLKRRYWRVACSMEHDDVMQEARIVFLRCAAKYPNVEAKHFMALFKTAWQRRFDDLSTADTKHRELYPYSPVRKRVDDELLSAEARLVGDVDNEGELRTKLRQAPREVKQVLTLILNAPAELAELALKSFREDRRSKTNPSAPICRMLGIREDLDVMQMTKQYFSEAAH